MTLEEVKAILGANSFIITEERRIPNNTGWRLRLASGQIVNVFDSGTYNVQGRNPDPIKRLLAEHAGEDLHAPPAVSRDVFVVYGHDEVAKTQLEAMLRR